MISPYSNPDEQPYKEQTRFKHDILSNYMTLWGNILGKPRPDQIRKLHYVDCFAAGGRYSEDHPGSPIIAMRIGQELNERNKDCFLECHFVERNLANYNSLRACADRDVMRPCGKRTRDARSFGEVPSFPSEKERARHPTIHACATIGCPSSPNGLRTPG